MAARLTIGRLAIAARLPRDHGPAPAGLAADLREAGQRLLAPLLARALDRAGVPQGEGTLLIRSLRVDLTVLLRWDPARIAARLAEAIAQAVARAAREGGGAAARGAIRIEDGAAHLAQVLADVSAGRGGLWHHGAWRALADRPAAEALAGILEAAGAQGPRALGLGGPDAAARILRRVGPPAVARLHAAWGLEAQGPHDEARPPLRQAAATARASLPPDILADAPRRALAVLALLAAAHPDVAAELLSAAAAPRAPRTVVRDGPEPAARTTSGASPPAATSRPAVQAPQVAPRAAAATSRAEAQQGFTAQAGLVLLWRDAVTDGLPELAARLAGTPERGAASMARALAGPDAEDPVQDPLLRLLLDLAEDPGPVPPARLPAADVLDALAAIAWPPLRPAALVLERLGGEDAPWLCADAATGEWLRLAPRASEAVLPGLPVLADAGVLPGAAAPGPDGRRWSGLAQGEIPPAPPPALARMPGRPARDAAALAPRGAPDTATALAWAALAQHVLRRFARRVPGFAHAGPDWLRANLLPRAGTWHAAPEDGGTTRILLRLQPPPLALLLRLSGMVPAEWTLPGGVVLGLALETGG